MADELFQRISFLIDSKIIKTITPSIKLKSSEILNEGNTPVISQDKQYIIGYSNEIDKKLNQPPYIVFGDHTEIIKWVPFSFLQGADGIKVLKSTNENKINNIFLYYALKNFYNPTGFYQRHFKNLKRTYIPTYKTETQTKIVSILSKYDELIENNNKRIKILESMAESIYKEWFVRFRFPGYERVAYKIQTAIGWSFGSNNTLQKIPMNWSFGELKNIAVFKKGTNITIGEIIKGEVPVISAGLEPMGFHNQANVTGYNLTVSASGANAGYLNYHLEDIWAADCSYYQNDQIIWFVYNALKFLQPVISNMQVGSAQPHVYAKNLNKIYTIIPDKNIISLFMKNAKPIYEHIKILKNKNNALSQQRDALLPKLMSGKIDLEHKEVI
ncbi:restriction endonuclease subunit S [Mycoplasmopsis felifaucium]|uniref:Restriction endonuclease subunit S n=1 Tax=Mycoplasmopsis felifaucium TaxID=35768 RepID=A0ABZ2RW35_9BACT